ncbi:hypothetical protein BU26DRAFT_540758 [Trematosphaeria pertusa]|uniref:Uncharacterized protein n=1 Tax=Trematosphaeria pertusa TaxID=390896 RepID=A0A6A6IB57_9PLEO|nr:uncharacterized protein BU26DRAFT_540758 [Trematosphaeria pertusa]KAF2247804.1 hypothetical protein BU26DRAFT_540758 [Trematosphaeria pertusa]
MLALRPLLKKPRGDDKEIKQFHTKVAVDQRELKTLLQQRLHQAEKENSRRRNELACIIFEALQTPNQGTRDDVATFPRTAIANNVLFNSAGRVNTACQSLLVEYNTFETMIAEMAGEDKNPITETWTRDMEETERLLKLGHRTALRNVKQVLGAEDGEGEDGDMEEAEDKNHAELNYELLKSLRYAERGVKRMVKGIPKDETGS